MLEDMSEEYRFHPVRKWRLDFAWANYRVAVELDGGQFMKHGRHSGAKDYEKLNEAVALGWLVLRFVPSQLKKPQYVADVVRRTIEARES